MSNIGSGGGEKAVECVHSHAHACTRMILASQVYCLSWRRLRKKVKMSSCVNAVCMS